MPPLSRTSSTTSITKPDPVAFEYELEPHSEIPSTTFARHHRLPRPAKTHLTGHFTPQTHPPASYNRYVLCRCLSVSLCLLQIILVSIAASGALSSSYAGSNSTDYLKNEDNPQGDPRKKLKHWLDPCLSPAISAFCWCATDLLSVWKWQRRSHHIARGVYDAVLAIGFTIAGGFFLHMASGVLSGRDRDAGYGNLSEMVVGGLIAVCMGSEVILHSIISYEGIRDMIETRKAVRSNWGIRHEA